MKKASTYRLALPLLAVAVAAIAFALMAGKSSAQGRTLDGTFHCGTGNFTGRCIGLTFGDTTAQGFGTTHPVLTLDPGQYWFSLADDSPAHNYALRSCPGSDSPCGPAGDPSDELTPLTNMTEVDVTEKILLKQGWYRLLCAARGHEAGGMYLDIHVVGDDAD